MEITGEITFAQHPRHHRFVDLTSRKFGRLTVLGFAGSRRGCARWFCECECGVTTEVYSSNLIAGNVRSCGCLIQAEDLTNLVFGRLTVIEYVVTKKGVTFWLCDCECGNTTTIRGPQLRSGRTQSCGCLREELRGTLYRSHGRSRTSEYNCYHTARSRCRNPSQRSYPLYGGRGIAFRFESFEQFFAVLGPKPSPEYSIDRINNDGHYEPSNVRWATPEEQARNRRPARKGM